MRVIYFSLLFFFIAPSIVAQITGKITDAATGEAIPYASVLINASEHQISNAEGYFTISAANSSAASVLRISFLGYAVAQLTVAELKDQQLIAPLRELTYELDPVLVAKKLSAAEIMAEVKRNLKRNYGSLGPVSKDKVFLRESTRFSPKTLDVAITQSTGFTKSTLQSVNKELQGFASTLVSHPPQEFTDMLCHYYATDAKAAAAGKANKMVVVKATKLRDDSRSVSLEGLQGSAAKLLLKHLDTTKYYRIKSGWFGSRDTISLRKDFNKGKKKPVRNELTSSKSRLVAFRTKSNFLNNSALDFVSNPEIYTFTHAGMVYLNDTDFAYVLTFKPKKGKAKYTGKLYVAADDFAIVRADYSLADGKKLNGFNMKLLLGVKTYENVSVGALIYKRDPLTDGYYLQYASEEGGQYIYVNRPLKFIELSESEKDVVAFDLKLEGNIMDKTEYLDLSREEITSSEFDQVTEADFAYVRIKQYDPAIWKDHSAIEPLQEMKRYTIEQP